MQHVENTPDRPNQPPDDGSSHGFRIEEAAQVEPSPIVEHPFEFRGTSVEFFRIWIVNVALTILTLGVYSAWAKVRTERYFYGNTWVAGIPFEYQAKPLAVLVGRLVALVFFSAYVIVSQFFPMWSIAVIALLFLLTPWIMVRSLRFRARYAAWANLNFQFVGRTKEAYLKFFLLTLLAPFTMWVLYPYIKAVQKRYVISNHRFGGKNFGWVAKNEVFYLSYLIALGMFFALIALGFGSLAFMAFLTKQGMPDWVMVLPIALFYGGYFLVYVFLLTRIANITYSHTLIAGHGLTSKLRARHVAAIYLTNTLAILFTLGLAVPWAMVRLAQYRARSTTLLLNGGLGDFIYEAKPDEAALALELSDVFDLDIGL